MDRLVESGEHEAWLTGYDLRYFMAELRFDNEYGLGVVAAQRTMSQGRVDKREIKRYLVHIRRAMEKVDVNRQSGPVRVVPAPEPGRPGHVRTN